MIKPKRPKSHAKTVYEAIPELAAKRLRGNPEGNMLRWGVIQEHVSGDGVFHLDLLAPDLTPQVQAVNAAVGWVQLADLLEKVAADPSLRSAPDAVVFTRCIADLVRWHGVEWGADGVFEAIAKAFAAHAGQQEKAEREDTRTLVRAEWVSLARKLVPERSRSKQIAHALGLSLRQVQDVVRDLGLRAVKREKRG